MIYNNYYYYFYFNIAIIFKFYYKIENFSNQCKNKINYIMYTKRY